MDRYDQQYASKVGMEEIALGMKRQKVVGWGGERGWTGAKHDQIVKRESRESSRRCLPPGLAAGFYL